MPAITGDLLTSNEVIPVISLEVLLSLALRVFRAFDDSPNVTETELKYILTKLSRVPFRRRYFRAGQLGITKMPVNALAKGDTGAGTVKNLSKSTSLFVARQVRKPRVLLPGSELSLTGVPKFNMFLLLHYRA